MSETTPEDLADWIPAAAAARLVPSPRGKRTAISTIYRMVADGRLAGWTRAQNGGQKGPRKWLFVRRSEVLALLTPVPRPRQVTPQVASAEERAAEDRWTKATLARFGLTSG